MDHQPDDWITLPETPPVIGGGKPPPEIGGYRIAGKLGEGGMGVVYRAQEPGTGREVALKVISAGQVDATDLARFQREIEAGARLRHPAIVRLLRAGNQTDPQSGREVQYFAMDLVEGEALDRRLARGPLAPRAAVALGRRVAEALGAAHRAGLVHRDIKPGNILLDGEGAPFLTDFGLAQVQEVSRSLTRSGTIVGTPLYLSPEQAAGDPLTPASDVFSLGAVLYEAISGQPIRSGPNTIAVIVEALSRDPVPLARLPGLAVGREIALVVMTCLARDPARRYADGAALACELDRLERGEPVLARPPSLGYRLSCFVRRRRGVAAVLLLNVLLLAGWLGLLAHRRLALARQVVAARREARRTARGFLDDVLQRLEQAARADPVAARAALDGLEARLAPGALRAQLERNLEGPAWNLLPRSEREAAVDAALPLVRLPPLRARLALRRARLATNFAGEVRQLASAYLLAPRSAPGRQAYLALGRRYFEERKLAGARGIFAALAARAPDTAEGREARAWLGRTLLRLGRFEAACAALRSATRETGLAPEHGLAERLAAGLELRLPDGFSYEAAAAWRPAPGSPVQLALCGGDRLLLYAPPYNGPPRVERFPDEKIYRLVPLPLAGGRSLLLLTLLRDGPPDSSRLLLLDLDRGRLVQRAVLPAGGGGLAGAVIYPLPDRPGEALVAQRFCIRLRYSGERLTREAVELPGRRPTEQVRSLLQIEDTLYAGYGEWSAYDLRAYRVARGADWRVERQIGRILLGRVQSLQAFGNGLAVQVYHEPLDRNPLIFGPGMERLREAGLHLLDRSLKPVQKIPRALRGRLRRVRIEGAWLTAPLQHGTLLVGLHQARPHVVEIEGAVLHPLGDLDGDAEDELLEQRAGRLLLRGLGRLARPRAAATSPPVPELTGEERTLWLIEELMRLSLWEAATAGLQQLIAQPGAAELRRRAERLLFRVRLACRPDWDAAAALGARLLRQPAGKADVLWRLAALEQARGDHAARYSLLQRLAAEQGCSQADRTLARREAQALAPFVGRRVRVELPERGGAWPVPPVLDTPLALRLTADGLSCTGLAGWNDATALWPLMLDGGPFELRIAGRLERIDFGARLLLGLLRRDTGGRLELHGGVELSRSGGPWNQWFKLKLIQQRPAVAQTTHKQERTLAGSMLDLRLRYLGAGRPLELLARIDQRTIRLVQQVDAVIPAGRYLVGLAPAVEPSTSNDVRCRMVLQSIRLLSSGEGVKLLPSPPATLLDAHGFFLAGRWAEAAALYQATGERLLAGLAWSRAGCGQQAHKLLREGWRSEWNKPLLDRVGLLQHTDLVLLGRLHPGLRGLARSPERLIELGFAEEALALPGLDAATRAAALLQLDRYREALPLYRTLGNRRMAAYCEWRIKVAGR